jgi:hypothetical protein
LIHLGREMENRREGQMKRIMKMNKKMVEGG